MFPPSFQLTIVDFSTIFNFLGQQRKLFLLVFKKVRQKFVHLSWLLEEMNVLLLELLQKFQILDQSLHIFFLLLVLLPDNNIL